MLEERLRQILATLLPFNYAKLCIIGGFGNGWCLDLPEGRKLWTNGLFTEHFLPVHHS